MSAAPVLVWPSQRLSAVQASRMKILHCSSLSLKAGRASTCSHGPHASSWLGAPPTWLLASSLSPFGEQSAFFLPRLRNCQLTGAPASSSNLCVPNEHNFRLFRITAQKRAKGGRGGSQNNLTILDPAARSARQVLKCNKTPSSIFLSGL